MKFLLDYVFPITVITPTPQASTAFLKQACVVAKPKAGQEGNVGTIYECVNMTQVAARTDNTDAQQLFTAGMSKVYILLSADLDLTDALSGGAGSDFYTLLVASGTTGFGDSDIAQVVTSSAVQATKTIGDLIFTAVNAGVTGNDITITLADTTTEGNEIAHAVGNVITVAMQDATSTAQEIADAIEESTSCSALVTVAIAMGQEAVAQDASGPTNLADGAAAVFDTGTGVQVGTWKGVIGVSSDDPAICTAQAILPNRSCFLSDGTNLAQNMMFAFGKLLSATAWANQQYIDMPLDDGVDELGEATSLFDDKVSFVISDDEFGLKLALFAVGGKAIVAPYIIKDLSVNLQSRALQWIALNQPQYTMKEASLLETRLQEDVIKSFIAQNLIVSGTVSITLVNQNFVATGDIEVPEPKALWRVESVLRQTV